MANPIQEIIYQVGEAWKGEYQQNMAYGNAAVVQDATGLSVYRSRKSGNAGHPLSDTEWWLCIIDLSSIKQASDDIAGLNADIAQAEAARVEAEASRVTAENARAAAEGRRVDAESQRASAETGRDNQERTRQNSETVRVQHEQTRVAAETTRVSNEEARVEHEQARVSNETARQTNENNRTSAETTRISNENTRVASETSRVTHEQQRELQAASDHSRAEGDHTTATTDHSTATTDHSNAVTDHSNATSDHSTATTDHTTAAADHTASVAATEAAIEAAAGANDWREKLESGEVVPALAADLDSWKNSAVPVNDTFDDVVRTTAGDTSIDTAQGGVLRSIVAATDFSASEFRATGFNLLRDAVAVGTGYFFLVPALPFGTFGTATRPNGLLFTNSAGENLHPTVYFKPLADGEPTSVTDGTVCPYTDANDYRFYNPASVGFIIVSDITLNSTCAHVAWSRRYDEYKAVNASGDAGSTITLTDIIAAIQPVALKMLAVGAVADRIDWLTNGTATWQRNVGITTPTWTTVPDEVEEGATQTYTHSATIVDIRDGGSAELCDVEGTALSTDGTTVSYQDTSSVATSAQVKYELSSPATGTVSRANTFSLEDWGLEKLSNVSGTAIISTEYKQGIADTYLAAAPQVSKLRYNAAQVSLGFGVCSTVADATAKVVTIADFLLLVNGLVTVVFTQGITATGATLNVSGTGAKPILVNGNPIEAGIIGPHTTAQLIYDGTAYHLVSLMAQKLNPADLFVDMGLTSGLKWAKANIDLTQPNGFAKSAFQYECSFFSWGNIFGHNPKTNTSFDYDWGGVNDAEPYYQGQPYGSTPGNTLVASFAADSGFDAARVNLGAPWRMPTSAEFQELFNNIIYIDAAGNQVPTEQADKRVTVNGITGIYLQSTVNGNRLFFPCSGYGLGRSRSFRGSRGFYWSSTWFSARSARLLYFSSSGVYPQYDYGRRYGFAVRPVQ